MLKKRVLKPFSSFILLFLFFGQSNSFGQQSKKNQDCYILAKGKKIPLFANLLSIRKIIPVSHDIESLDTSSFAYGYSEKEKKIDTYVIGTQFIFFVDTSTKNTIRQELFYVVERRIKDGNIDRTELKKLFGIIKKQNMPFLVAPVAPNFNSSYNIGSVCHPYTIKITGVEDEYSDKSVRQFTISISMSDMSAEK